MPKRVEKPMVKVISFRCPVDIYNALTQKGKPNQIAREVVENAIKPA